MCDYAKYIDLVDALHCRYDLDVCFYLSSNALNNSLPKKRADIASYKSVMYESVKVLGFVTFIKYTE